MGVFERSGIPLPTAKMNEKNAARGIRALSRYRPRRTSAIRAALGECANLLADGELSEDQAHQFAHRMLYALAWIGDAGFHAWNGCFTGDCDYSEDGNCPDLDGDVE